VPFCPETQKKILFSLLSKLFMAIAEQLGMGETTMKRTDQLQTIKIFISVAAFVTLAMLNQNCTNYTGQKTLSSSLAADAVLKLMDYYAGDNNENMCAYCHVATQYCQPNEPEHTYECITYTPNPPSPTPSPTGGGTTGGGSDGGGTGQSTTTLQPTQCAHKVCCPGTSLECTVDKNGTYTLVTARQPGGHRIGPTPEPSKLRKLATLAGLGDLFEYCPPNIIYAEGAQCRQKKIMAAGMFVIGWLIPSRAATTAFLDRAFAERLAFEVEQLMLNRYLNTCSGAACLTAIKAGMSRIETKIYEVSVQTPMGRTDIPVAQLIDHAGDVSGTVFKGKFYPYKFAEEVLEMEGYQGVSQSFFGYTLDEYIHLQVSRGNVIPSPASIWNRQ
jgi:hypothetical protein